jgi:lysophospholipase L1-like esterase
VRFSFRSLFAVIVLGLVRTVPTAAAIALPSDLTDARRVLFLGDSITHAGGYVDLIETALLVRFPDKRFDIVNLGLPSETVSGLSEPDHAGGRFPRPHLHERLDRALEAVKPHLVFACYGMNDGIYHPPSQERLEKYRAGILKLQERVAAAKAKLILLTPPVFDPMPIQANAQPAEASAYSFRKPYAGYNEVLSQYSNWLRSLRIRDVTVIDVHGPMSDFLADQKRKEGPSFALSTDGVHPNEVGNAAIARPILEAWDLLRRVDHCALVKAETRGDIEFTLPQSLPLPNVDSVSETAGEPVIPRDMAWLKVTELPATHYGVFEGARKIGQFSSDELSWGVNILNLPDGAPYRRSLELYRLVIAKNKLLRDAWVNHVGHKRPGDRPGLPLPEAQTQAAALQKKIDEVLAAPPEKLILRAE